MQIKNLQEQKLALGKAYVKSYNDLFANYLNKLNAETTIEEKQGLSKTFYDKYKKLNNTYEQEKYKISIQEQPSITTMYSAINYKQKLLIDNMNAKLKEENDELNKKILSGKYTLSEKTKFQKEYDDLEQNLKDSIFKEIANFRSSYYNALIKRDTSKIDQLENSLLTNLLSKI